jgi:hypothetical protein
MKHKSRCLGRGRVKGESEEGGCRIEVLHKHDENRIMKHIKICF